MAKKQVYKVKNTLTIDNVSFNTAWASGVSEDAFVAHEKGTGLEEAKLREIHQLIAKQNGNNQEKVEDSKPVQSGKGSSK